MVEKGGLLKGYGADILTSIILASKGTCIPTYLSYRKYLLKGVMGYQNLAKGDGPVGTDSFFLRVLFGGFFFVLLFFVFFLAVFLRRLDFFSHR